MNMRGKWLLSNDPKRRLKILYKQRWRIRRILIRFDGLKYTIQRDSLQLLIPSTLKKTSATYIRALLEKRRLLSRQIGVLNKLQSKYLRAYSRLVDLSKKMVDRIEMLQHRPYSICSCVSLSSSESDDSN